MTTTPMPNHEIADLLERVRSLTGPIDYITAAGIANDLSPWETESEEWHLFIKALGSGLEALGAALALVERVRPGTLDGNVMLGYDKSCTICVAPHKEIEGEGATLPLAVLAALLLSMEAKDND